MATDISAAPSSDGSQDRFRWDRMTVSIALGYCLLVASLSAGIVLAELREQFAIGGVVAALHGSMFGLALIVVSLTGVRALNGLGRHRSLRLAAGLMAGGAIVFIVGQRWEVTLSGTAAAGLGAALFVVIVPGLVSDHHRHHRSQAFAALNAVPLLFAMLLSLSVGGALALGWSWRLPYFAIASLTIFALAATARPVAAPAAAPSPTLSLRTLRQRNVAVPWLFLVNAVLVEFVLAVWATTYLQEVGGASSGLAPALASLFAVAMFASRLLLPRLIAGLGERVVVFGFIGAAFGAVIMFTFEDAAIQTVGLAIIGFCLGPNYPLCVERLYAWAEPTVSTVELGAVAALGSGVAITTAPLVAGVIADVVGLRSAVLLAAAFAIVGAITQRGRSWYPVPTE